MSGFGLAGVMGWPIGHSRSPALHGYWLRRYGIAGAYAEKSPVVVLGGAPGMNERDRNPLLHHKVKGFETQFEVLEKVTVASTVLGDPLTAFSEIDRVLAARAVATFVSVASAADALMATVSASSLP